ncbi:MAG: T9SS type A sorting domain-containing protein, partial [Salibacteraceae bacterium]
SLSASAQTTSWSTIALSDDFPTEAPGQVNTLTQQPKAMVVNGHNEGSVYPVGTMYSAISLKNDATSNYQSLNPGDLGTWILAIGQDGSMVMSKKIVIPASLNYWNDDVPPTSVVDHLEISALRYDYSPKRELLVFTGALLRNDGGTQPEEYQTMVVGTYNLRTDDVCLQYLKNIYYYEDPVTFQPIRDEVGSKGIDLAPIHNNTGYMALGQSERYNATGATNNLGYPVAMSFQVQDDGKITMGAIRWFEFRFLVHAIETYKGNGVLAYGGFKRLYSGMIDCDNDFNYTGLGFIHFKDANYTNITLVTGETVVVEDYYYRYASPIPSEKMDMVMDQNNIYFSFEDINNNTNQQVNLGKLDYNLTNLSLRRYQLGSGLAGTAHKLILKPESLEAILYTEDQQQMLGLPNTTPVGIMEVSRDNLTASGPVDLLFTEDIFGQNQVREFTNVTGLHNDCGRFDFVMADGSGKITDASRVHTYGVFNDEYQCHVSEDISGATLCGIIYPFTYFGKTFTLNNVATVNASVLTVQPNEESCDTEISPRKAVADAEQALLDTDDTPSPIVEALGYNQFQIRHLNEAVNSWYLIDMAGKQVPAEINGAFFDLSHLPSGVYWLSFTTNGKRYSEKLMVYQ